MRRTVWTHALVALVLCPLAHAQQIKTFKHDKYSENIYEAVSQVNGTSAQVEPGFVYGEAFGAMFRPGEPDYPMKLLGVDVIFAGPTAGIDQSTVIDIEVYLDAGTGPAPTSLTPDYVISSTEFWNPDTNDFGIPIKGNIAYQFDFSYEEPESSPPLVEQGNVIVMVRFKKAAMSLEAEWNTLQCVKLSDIGACGCQPAGMLLDAPTQVGGQLTPKTNIMHIVWPLGTCSGNKAWHYFDDITLGTKKLAGDAVLRLRVQSADPGCVGSCEGKSCGDDGCGNPCGFCEDDEICQAGACVLECTPDCDGKECGDDGCGGDCGTCTGGATCEDGVCAEPCVPDCEEKECGADGCGGTCGMCVTAFACFDGLCVADDCIPACEGKQCGTDGCGAACGTCGAGETCMEGWCQPADGTPVTPSDLSISRIDPEFGAQGQQTPVSILGDGFTGDIAARIGGIELIGVEVVNAGLITATVPGSLEAGSYDLILSDDAGGTTFLEDAFEVRAPQATCGDGTCGEGESCATCPEDCGGQCPDLGGSHGAPASGCDVGHGPSSPAALLLLVLTLLGVLRLRLE